MKNVCRMLQRSAALLVVIVLGWTLGPGTQPLTRAQQVPEAVQRELAREGLTPEEARERARQLGINLSNPEQAVQRARQLGIPEARIQALLQAVQRAQQRGEQASSTRPIQPGTTLPVLAGAPTINPDTVQVDRLPQTVRVEVPLRNEEANIIQRVEPFFLTADGDTAMVENIERVSGSVIDGVWGGEYPLPTDTETGTWTLFVRVASPDSSTILQPDEQLLITDKELDRPETPIAEERLSYFGYDTFNNVPASFQPNPVGPVDDGYIIGPNDELRLTLWGGTDLQRDLQVDREGRVYIPEVGQFTVAGKRLDALRTEMRQWLSQDFAGLASDPPTVFMDLTLTRLRPVQVFVLGEVPQPGGYTVGSYATVFNALYSVGGPLQRGSLRNIKVIREGEVVATVDLYNYLLQGYSPNPVQLQTNDYVYVPPRGKTVGISGAVKRPAFYEMKPGETMTDLLDYAGGLNPEAYTQRFQIDRIVPFEERMGDAAVARRTLDFNLNAVRSGERTVSLADGDRIRIRSLMEASDPAATPRINRVEVTGAVFQPGTYELGPEVRTVRDLIQGAEGLTGGAYRQRAELIRVQDDLSESMHALNLNAVMDDEPTANLVLQPGDSLFVASIQERRRNRTVQISGQVRRPGRYSYRDSMTVGDLLFLGGGLEDSEYLKDVFLGRADLYRESPDGSTERVIPFHLGDALDGEGIADRPLRPGDKVRVYARRVEELEEQFVTISGAVRDTGRYEFRDNLTLKDLILQANGFEEGASLRTVEVTRMRTEDHAEEQRAHTIQVPLVPDEKTEQVSFSVRDTVQALAAADQFQLQHRDRVYVRTNPNFEPQQIVTVRGEVQYPGKYTLLRDNELLSDVLQRAGGVLQTGYPKGGRLLRNGEQVITEMGDALEGKRESDVILRPGDEIIIPPQPNTVAIRGNVANEGLIKYQPGRRVSYYLDRAGGALDNTKDVFLTQASGATFKVKTGWFRVTPEVDDGAIIRVTEEEPKPERQQVDIGQTIRDVTGILSSALTIIVLATRAFD